jgi:hypothetical protein
MFRRSPAHVARCTFAKQAAIYPLGFLNTSETPDWKTGDQQKPNTPQKPNIASALIEQRSQSTTKPTIPASPGKPPQITSTIGQTDIK